MRVRPLRASVLLAVIAVAKLSDGFEVIPTAGRIRGCDACVSAVPLLRRRVRAGASTFATAFPDASSKTNDGDDDHNATVFSWGYSASSLPSADNPLLSHPSVSDRWKGMYLRLQTYREVHGHCRVPRRYHPDPSLGGWVAYQRHLRNRLRRGSPGKGGYSTPGSGESDGGGAARSIPLTNAHIVALDALNFTWDLREHAWRERIDQLARYYREEGGRGKEKLVPPDHPDRGLATFVRNQRRQYAKYVAGKSSTLTPSRVEDLVDVGFHFGSNHTDMWDRRYNELVQFALEHGHASVPEQYDANPALGRWVAHQRVRYRESTLRADRVEALQRIDGFRWEGRSHSWSVMLDRLRVHANETGDFVLSRHDASNHDLRMWVRVQRYHRALHERGMPSPLSEDRIAALDAINFTWTPPRGPRRCRKEENGPSADDWSKLFEELKDRGIDAGGEVKEHWFAGKRSFEKEDQELKEWDETDVMSLWEQGDDEDDW